MLLKEPLTKVPDIPWPILTPATLEAVLLPPSLGGSGPAPQGPPCPAPGTSMPLGHVWLLRFRNLGRQIHLVVQNNINRWISNQSHVLSVSHLPFWIFMVMMMLVRILKLLSGLWFWSDWVTCLNCRERKCRKANIFLPTILQLRLFLLRSAF